MTTPMPTSSHLDGQPTDLVPMRDARDDEIPASARRLADIAVANGWAVRITYAAGYAHHRDGTPTESLAVRMRGTDRGLVACWIDNKSSGCWRVGPERHPQRGEFFIYRVSSRELVALAKESQILSA